jgi:signal peptidase I
MTLATLGARLREYGRELGLGLLLRKDSLPKPEVPSGAGRRQLEGFAVAIAMALMLKQFTFDTFQVPTESMEPAIIGRGDWGDRLLVDRFAYVFSDPERYDIVVFKYPLSRLVNYVKRAIGLPGERVLIFRGQIYAAPGGGLDPAAEIKRSDFKITRKPDAVQEAVFRNNPVIPAEDSEDLDSSKFFRHWEPGGGPVPAFDGASKGIGVTAPKDGERLFRTKNPITDARHDPKAADAKGKGGGTERVGDVRISVSVTPKDCESVILEIHDPVLPGQPLRLECGVEGRGNTRLLKGQTDLSPPGFANVKIENGERAKIQFQNADQRLVVRIDGKEVARADYEVVPVDSPAMDRDALVKVGVRSGGASFTELGLERDLFYTKFDRVKDEFAVPAGNYLMLGDNSPNSLDARGWKRSRIRVRNGPEDPGIVLDGDFEAVSDRIENSRRMQNPYPDDDGTPAFIDVHGNERHLKPGLYDVLDARTGAVALPAVEDIRGVNPTLHAVYDHFVPREYIIGRAAIVFFWPIRVLR